VDRRIQIAWGEHHWGKRAERVTQPARSGAIDGDFLSLCSLIEANGQLVLDRRLRNGADVESCRVEAGEIDVARLPNGSQNLEIIDRLEKVGLAVSVVANQCDAIGGELEIHPLEVTEIPDGDALEPNPRTGGRRDGIANREAYLDALPLKLGVRFSWNAPMPSRLSS